EPIRTAQSEHMDTTSYLHHRRKGPWEARRRVGPVGQAEGSLEGSERQGGPAGEAGRPLARTGSPVRSYPTVGPSRGPHHPLLAAGCAAASSSYVRDEAPVAPPWGATHRPTTVESAGPDTRTWRTPGLTVRAEVGRRSGPLRGSPWTATRGIGSRQEGG